jgi:hypothetical protein
MYDGSCMQTVEIWARLTSFTAYTPGVWKRLMTATNTPADGVDLPRFDDYAAPLVKPFTVRLTATQYAHLACRGLCEGNGEGAVLRRWLVKGAAAEGIDLLSF